MYLRKVPRMQGDEERHLGDSEGADLDYFI